MKNRRPSLFSRAARVISLIAVGFTLGFAGGFLLAASRTNDVLARFDLPRESIDLLQEFYLGDLPEPIDMQRGMTRGLLDSVEDPYTTYLDPVANELEEQTLQGTYGGIGAFLSPTELGWVLIPFEDGPADQAGIREGDRLLRADSTPIHSALSEAEVIAALRGLAGTVVEVEIIRDESEIIVYQIFRQVLPLPSASSYILPDHPAIGVLNLTGFGSPTADEVRQNLNSLQSEGATAIILDIRGNPGGLLDSALKVADIFLSDGIIVTELAYDGGRTDHRAQPNPQDIELPVVVLVDGGTASAAEVLAAALMGNDRAELIGQPTFGKGSVQSIYGLSDGSSLHITTSRWLDPNGEAIDHDGLVPDQEVEPGNGSNDTALQAAISWLQIEREEQE